MTRISPNILGQPLDNMMIDFDGTYGTGYYEPHIENMMSMTKEFRGDGKYYRPFNFFQRALDKAHVESIARNQCANEYAYNQKATALIDLWLRKKNKIPSNLKYLKVAYRLLKLEKSCQNAHAASPRLQFEEVSFEILDSFNQNGGDVNELEAMLRLGADYRCDRFMGDFFTSYEHQKTYIQEMLKIAEPLMHSPNSRTIKLVLLAAQLREQIGNYIDCNIPSEERDYSDNVKQLKELAKEFERPLYLWEMALLETFSDYFLIYFQHSDNAIDVISERFGNENTAPRHPDSASSLITDSVTRFAGLRDEPALYDAFKPVIDALTDNLLSRSSDRKQYFSVNVLWHLVGKYYMNQLEIKIQAGDTKEVGQSSERLRKIHSLLLSRHSGRFHALDSGAKSYLYLAIAAVGSEDYEVAEKALESLIDAAEGSFIVRMQTLRMAAFFWLAFLKYKRIYSSASMSGHLSEDDVEELKEVRTLLKTYKDLRQNRTIANHWEITECFNTSLPENFIKETQHVLDHLEVSYPSIDELPDFTDRHYFAYCQNSSNDI